MDGVHVQQHQDGATCAAIHHTQDVIAGLGLREGAHFCPAPAQLVGDQAPDGVHAGFVGAERLGHDQLGEQIGHGRQVRAQVGDVWMAHLARDDQPT